MDFGVFEKLGKIGKNKIYPVFSGVSVVCKNTLEDLVYHKKYHY